jgi:predicted GH43/DUF377 family glycosyl hydrolase
MKNECNGVHLRPDAGRVLLRPFVPEQPARIVRIIERALALSDAEVAQELRCARAEFEARHRSLDRVWRQHCRKVQGHLGPGETLSDERKTLIGALFSGEYAIESTALFNPSIVVHADQGGLAEQELRVILSLRALGEEHISSIEFRSGVIGGDGSLILDQISPLVTAPEISADPTFRKERFLHKLKAFGKRTDWEEFILSKLDDTFTLRELEEALPDAIPIQEYVPEALQRTVQRARCLARANYEVQFDPSSALSERVLFPHSEAESNGMEDARLVRFVEDDETVTYYGTYTAYNGHAITPQLIETKDFCRFQVHTLGGSGIQNKGMALFPRRVDGRYAMLSRQDDENVFLMFSEDLHFWSDPEVLLPPQQPWEMVKVGNCGSPLETDAGWLVLTHGVGPVRKYCLGAALLDLQNPRKVLGRLREPLLKPQIDEWKGYVPNVVYSCGALIHRGHLVLPYGTNDLETRMVTLELDELLAAL